MEQLFPGYSQKLRKIAANQLESISGLRRDNSGKIEQCDRSHARISSLPSRFQEMVIPLMNWIFIFLDGDEHGAITLSPEKVTGLTKEEYSKKEAQIVNLQREVESNAQSIDGLESKVKSQCEELQTKATKIASLEVDILTKSMQVCCLQGTNESQNEKINTLQQKVEDFEHKITDLQADIIGKVREIARLKCDAKKCSENLESKKAQIISLVAEVKEKTDQIKQLEAKRITERKQ